MLIEHISTEGILFFILYGISGVVPLLAALYLLLRQGNVFAQGVTPPVRLRRWTASFFAVSTLAHVWWLLFYIYSGDQQSVAYLVLVMLDCMLLFTTFVGMLLAMLQDRHRPVWPALVAIIPFVALGGAFTVNPNELMAQLPVVIFAVVGIAQHSQFYGYELPYYWQLAVIAAFVTYYIVALRQYGHWLLDNYADLERKEVWQSLAAVMVLLMVYMIYTSNAGELLREYLSQIISIVIIVFLVWRVETLQELDSEEDELEYKGIDP